MSKVSKKQRKKAVAKKQQEGISFSRVYYEIEKLRPSIPKDIYHKVTKIVGDMYRIREWGPEQGVSLERRALLDRVASVDLIEMLNNYVTMVEVNSKHVFTEISTSTSLFDSSNTLDYHEEFDALEELKKDLTLLEDQLDRHLNQDVSEMKLQMTAKSQSFRDNLELG